MMNTRGGVPNAQNIIQSKVGNFSSILIELL
jgi:hypothetical protein